MSNYFSGMLVLIVGPSGVGKGTTVSLLKERHPEWVFPVSATTRPPRPGEKEGETYHFFSPEEFDEKIKNDAFIEWAWVHGKQKYGMLKSEIFPPLTEGKIVLREVDIQGFLDARKIVSKDSLMSFFLLPPSKETLIERIQNRAPISEKELKRRLESMENEMQYASECDFQIQTRDGRPILPVQYIEEKVGILMKEKPELKS